VVKFQECQLTDVGESALWKKMKRKTCTK